MNKSILACAISMVLGTAAQAAVTSVNVTSMDLGNNYAATGTLFNDGTGGVTSIDPFYGRHWTATAAGFFDATGVQQTFAGTSSASAFSYQFTLTAGQIAWGVGFDWGGSGSPTAVLAIMDCGVNPSVGDTCAGIGTPMQTPPFAGTALALNGAVASVSAVPIPAASWLMGAGLTGLIGVARRRKQATL